MREFKRRKVVLLMAPTCSEVDLAWITGIYEGEGSSNLSPSTTQVKVAQKDRWLLEKLQSMLGGSIDRGSKKGPYDRCGYWLLTGPRARGLLVAMYPRLSPRRQEQAKKALGPWREEALGAIMIRGE